MVRFSVVHLGAQNGYQIRHLEGLPFHLSKVDAQDLDVHLYFVRLEEILSVVTKFLMHKSIFLKHKLPCASKKSFSASKKIDAQVN